MSNVGVDYTGKKVIVGLTGRVGSSVAALLLKKQGMNVIGVSIVTNSSDSYDTDELFPKCHIRNLDQVKKFCESLKIPFYATDAKAEFDSEVIDPLISNKLTASANSSCFSCTHMRLKILYDKMKVLKADYIATGHFAKVHRNLNSEEFFIHSNNDPESDQAYLLAGLSGNILKHLMLPLGELKMPEVERISQKFSLGVEDSRDFKGFCFRKKESYLGFAKERVPKSLIKEGQVQNIDSDLYHGDHEGILNHYITESELNFKGVSPSDKDLEIVGYNFSSGIIQVGSKNNLSHKGFQIVKLNLGSGLDKKKPMQCFLKNKNSNVYIKCNLYFKNNATAMIETDDELYPLIYGEFFVLFDRDTRNAKVIGLGCVGNIGGFELIDRASDFRNKDEDGAKPVGTSQTFKF